MLIEQLTPAELAREELRLAARYAALLQQKLKLDLTRGKPGVEQLALSDALDGVLGSDFFSEDGTDLRNYGGIDGIIEAKRLFAPVLQVAAENMLIGGNSSLTLMYQCALFGMYFGFDGPQSAWQHSGPVNSRWRVARRCKRCVIA